jgi:hypothetical protein
MIKMIRLLLLSLSPLLFAGKTWAQDFSANCSTITELACETEGFGASIDRRFITCSNDGRMDG